MHVRTRLAVAAAVTLTAVAAPAAAAPARPAPAVPGGRQVAFQATPRTNAATRATATRPLAAYAGPWLRFQVSRVGAEAPEPALAIGPDGTAYVAAEGVAQNVTRPRMDVRQSDDGGRTWSSVRPAPYVGTPAIDESFLTVDDATGGVVAVDSWGGCSHVAVSAYAWQEGIACHPTLTSPTVAAGPPPPGSGVVSATSRRLYLCADSAYVVSCSMSSDGRTFGPTGAPAFTATDRGTLPYGCPVSAGHVAVGRHGEVLLPLSLCGEPWVAVSHDGGLTWRRSRVSDVEAGAGAPSLALGPGGTVYFAWRDVWESLPYLAVSRDGGVTWGRPLLVAPPGVRRAALVSVAAGSAGGVALTFLGASAGDAWDHWVLTSADARAPRPVLVAATTNAVADPVHRGTCTSVCGAGELADVAVDTDGAVWASAADTCPDRCAAGPGGTAAGGVVARSLSGPRLR